MRASLIIAAHNESDRLWRTVASCVETSAGLDCEIVAADDASWDDSVEETLRRFPQVRVVRHEERKGASPTKDLGARQTRGDTLIFLDGHTKPEPGAIQRLIEDVERLNGEAIITPAVTGLNVTRWKMLPQQMGHGYSLELERFDCAWLPLKSLRQHPHRGRLFYESPALIGCAFAVHRELYDDLRGFDPHMLCWGVEDLDFGLKSWLMGHPILHDPEPVIGHRFQQRFDNFEVPVEQLIVNQLRMARKNFTDGVWNDWLARCCQRNSGPLAGYPEGLWVRIWQLFGELRPSVEQERAHLLARRVHDEFWYAERFGLTWPKLQSEHFEPGMRAFEAGAADPSPSPSPSPSPCLITGVSIVIAGSTNTGPAYITAGNVIQLHADLSPVGVSLPPAEQVVWEVKSQPDGSPKIPVPDPTKQILDMAVQPSREYPGKYEISVTVCGQQDSFTIYAYVVSIKTVTYSGGEFKKVIRDSDALAAAGDQEYKPPHYTAPTDTTNEISRPVSFRRNSQMKLAMEFTCRGDGQPPSAKIRGYDTTIRSPGTAEPPDEEFDFPTMDATVEAGKLIVSETGLVAPGSSAAKLLPNVIAKLNSYPHFECHLPDDGDEWTNVGGSSNVVYVRLEQPIDGPLCETLLEIGCVAASGKNSRLGAYWPIRDKFASLNVTRIDSARLTYYDPADPDFRRSDVNDPSLLHAKTTTILTDSGYGGIVLADCVGFSDFFIHCLLAQGIGQIRMLEVYSAGPAIPAYPDGKKGVMVANWTFDPQLDFPLNSLYTPYNWKAGSHVRDEDGIGGHNNPNPPSDFANHVVVEFYVGEIELIDRGWVIFDSSYGLGYWSRELFEFGPNARIVGLSIWDEATETKFAMPKNIAPRSASQLIFVIGTSW